MKIADFGLSRVFQDTAMSRTICGTPAYVAPEVIMCMEGTRRSYDVSPSLYTPRPSSETCRAA